MEFPTLMNWMNPFQILELLGRIFHFNRSLCKQTVNTLIRHCILRSLVRVCLHCLPMSHKRTLMLAGLDMQPVQTLMRFHILWHLIWVYTVLLLCHLLETNHKAKRKICLVSGYMSKNFWVGR